MHRLLAPSIAAVVLSFVAACSSDPAADKAGPSSPTTVTTVATSSSSAGGAGGGGATVGTTGSGGNGGSGGGMTTSGTGGSGGAGGSGGGMDSDCSVDGNPGQCIDASACAALPDHTSTPGYCPGAANIECCTLTPNVADNPPIPAGYQLMMQADVTAAMTTWAVDILNDPKDYPMFATAMMAFGALTVLARVEWHAPDFQNNVVHRGVTLYEPG